MMSLLESIFSGMSAKNQRVFVAGGVSMGAFFLIWVGIAQPALLKTKSVETQKKELQEKEPVLNDVLGLEARLAAYQSSLAADRDMSALMGELSDMAEKAGLTNVSTALEKNMLTQEDEVEKLSISVEAMGTFHELGDFVSRIESLKRYVKISRAEFGKSMSSTSASMSEKPAKAGAKRISLLVSTFFSPKDLVSL